MNSLILCHPYIVQPTRITSHSKAIIDNIRSLASISYCTPYFFKCSQQKNPTFLNRIGQN